MDISLNMMNEQKCLHFSSKILKGIFLFGAFLLFSSVELYAQKVSLDIQAKTPAQILDQLSVELGLRFSYPSEVLNREEIDFKVVDENIDEVLNRLLKQFGLGFEFIDGNFIAIVPIEDVGVQLEFVIVDALDKEPLPYSAIQVQNSLRGTQSNDNGRFKFFVREPSESILEISYIGYETRQFSALDLYYFESDSIFLEPDVLSLDGFVVTEYLNSGITFDYQNNSIDLNPDELNVLPGLSEPDALYSLQQIPGISSSTETASDLNIRGGTSDQVSIYWDNIPVYHSAHYFGLISSFIPSSIDDISIYRNSVPVRYGGSASGLISMNSELRPAEAVSGNMDMNMTHFSGALSIPIVKNKLSLYVAGRRSLNDYYESPTFISYNEKLFDGSRLGESQSFAREEEFSIENVLMFWDLNSKINLNLNERNQITASYFQGRNTLDFSSIDQDFRTADFQYHNVQHAGANLNWRSQLTSNWTSEVSISNSRYKLDFEYLFQREIDTGTSQKATIFNPIQMNSSNECEEESEEECEEEEEEEEAEDQEENEDELDDPNEDDDFFDDRFEQAPDSLQDRGSWNNSLINTEIKWLNRVQLNKWSFLLGAQFNFMEIRYSLREENAFEIDELRAFYEKGNSYAGFTGLQFSPFELSNLELGLRLNHFSFVNSTTLDPQLSYRHQFNRLLLKTSISRKHQSIRTLQDVDNSISNTTEEIWFIADRESIPLIRNEQVMAGFVFQYKGWLFDVEGYLKNLTGLTTLGYTNAGSTIDEFETGNEIIQGVDVLLRKRFKRLRNWVSYSYSHSRSDFADLSDSRFVSQLDQPHKLAINTSYSTSRFEFSIGWQYKSGLPYTPISSQEAIRVEAVDDNDGDLEAEVFYEISYGEINSRRLPDYHRMDISAWYYFAGKRKSWTGKLGVSIQNVYNRTNILNRNFFVDQDGVDDEDEIVDIYSEQRQLLGITPNVTLSISF